MENVMLSSENDILTATLLCEIDHHSAVAVRETIDKELYKTMPQKLIFELSNVNFMDSSGLGLVLGRYAKSHEMGTEVIIKNPSQRIEKIFRMAGADKLIKIIYDDEKEKNNE